MKKMVLVSIVFVITSLSHAGMFLEAPDTIEHGGTINLAIVSDGPALDFAGTVWLNLSTNNSIGDALSNVILTPEDPFGNPEDPIMEYPEYPGLPDSFRFDLNYLPVSSELTIPRLTFDLTNSGTPLGGIIVIDFMDRTSGTGSTYYVEVVPEPATLLLVGLGGLMLRRRKKYTAICD